MCYVIAHLTAVLLLINNVDKSFFLQFLFIFCLFIVFFQTEIRLPGWYRIENVFKAAWVYKQTKECVPCNFALDRNEWQVLQLLAELTDTHLLARTVCKKAGMISLPHSQGLTAERCVCVSMCLYLCVIWRPEGGCIFFKDEFYGTAAVLDRAVESGRKDGSVTDRYIWYESTA